MESRECLLSSVLLLVALAGLVSGLTIDEVDGALGGSALFNVSAPLPALFSAQWTFKPSTTIVLLSPGGAPTYTPQYQGRCEVFNNASLGLDHLTYADQGEYTVQVTDFVTSGSENYNYHLNVYSLLKDAPILKINSSTPTELIGGTYLTLECDAGNQNVSTYSFSRDGNTICSEPHVSCSGAFLYFQPIATNDSGNYSCTIENPFSKISSNSLQLALLEPVSGVILTSNTSQPLWVGEDSVALHCSAQGTNVSYSWSLQGAPLLSGPSYHLSQNNAVLTISPVSANDNGTFTCTALNPVNSETSIGVNLTLAWRPERDILCTAEKINQSVHVGCSWPGGQPAANVTLKFQNITKAEENTVTANVTDDVTPGSQLTCHGDQFGRTSECALTFELPKFPGHTNNEVIKVEEGRTVKLEVRLVTPGLPATFQWFHNNLTQSIRRFTVQSTNFTSTLEILAATQEDNGNYVCEATNFVGSQSFLFILNVTKAIIPPPSPSSSPPTSLQGLDGGAIAGIVIGVLAGITLIGILVFFLVKKNKRKGKSKGINEPQVQLGNAEYAVVNKPKNKQNGGAAETAMTNTPQENNEDVKYAVLNFPNQASAKSPNTTPPETEYSEVKISTKT